MAETGAFFPFRDAPFSACFNRGYGTATPANNRRDKSQSLATAAAVAPEVAPTGWGSYDDVMACRFIRENTGSGRT